MSENAATVAAVNLTRRQNSFHSHPIDLYQWRGALGKLQLFSAQIVARENEKKSRFAVLLRQHRSELLICSSAHRGGG